MCCFEIRGGMYCGVAECAVLRSVAVYITSRVKLKRLNRALLEKLTGPQLVKKFPAFYGTRKFITAFTRAPHLFAS